MSYYSSYDQRNLTFFARERADGRIGFWWLADDTACWQAAKDDLRRTFNHATGLRYDPDEREWTVPRYSIDRLQRWANAWASRQEWNAERRRGRQNHYERQEQRQAAPESSVASAYKALHLLPTAPPELISAAYRALAGLHHPDHGGDTATMTALNQAVAVLREGATRRAS